MARRAKLLALPGLEPPPPERAARNRHEELDLQKDIVASLRQILFAQRTIVHASNHEVRAGGLEAKIEQGRIKAMGAFGGHTDLTVYDGPPAVLLFLEVKLPKTGRLSEEQGFFRDKVRAMGHHWAVVRSPQEAFRAVVAAGIPTRLARGYSL